MTAATATKLSDVKLAIGQEVWGYTASSQNVQNTDWQECTTIKRTGTYRYEISCGHRADGTGWTEYAATMKKAIELSGFDSESSVEGSRIATDFDGR